MALHEQIQIIAVTAQTTTLFLDERANDRWQGMRLYMQVTAVPGAPGTGGLRPRLKSKVPGFSPATYFSITADAPLVTTTGIFMYDWFPSASSGQKHPNVVQASSLWLPGVYQIDIEHLDGQAYDYKVWKELYGSG